MCGFIAQLSHEEAILTAERALAKPPFIGSEKPWHQDNAYFNWRPLEKVATAWLALDDATPENGCVWARAGSHREPLRRVFVRDRDRGEANATMVFVRTCAQNKQCVGCHRKGISRRQPHPDD